MVLSKDEQRILNNHKAYMKEMIDEKHAQGSEEWIETLANLFANHGNFKASIAAIQDRYRAKPGSLQSGVYHTLAPYTNLFKNMR